MRWFRRVSNAGSTHPFIFCRFCCCKLYNQFANSLLLNYNLNGICCSTCFRPYSSRIRITEICPLVIIWLSRDQINFYQMHNFKHIYSYCFYYYTVNHTDFYGRFAQFTTIWYGYKICDIDNYWDQNKKKLLRFESKFFHLERRYEWNKSVRDNCFSTLGYYVYFMFDYIWLCDLIYF